jgi:hypothetical protein
MRSSKQIVKISGPLGVFFCVALCGCWAAQVEGNGGRAARGVMLSRGPSVRAVTTGPVVLHAFSGFPGGAVFTAPVGAGTDADCAAARARPGAREERLVPDRRLVFEAAPGQTVCFAVDVAGGFELLWHAVPTRRIEPAPVLTAKGGPRGVVP